MPVQPEPAEPLISSFNSEVAGDAHTLASEADGWTRGSKTRRPKSGFEPGRRSPPPFSTPAVPDPKPTAPGLAREPSPTPLAAAPTSALLKHVAPAKFNQPDLDAGLLIPAASESRMEKTIEQLAPNLQAPALGAVATAGTPPVLPPLLKQALPDAKVNSKRPAGDNAIEKLDQTGGWTPSPTVDAQVEKAAKTEATLLARLDKLFQRHFEHIFKQLNQDYTAHARQAQSQHQISERDRKQSEKQTAQVLAAQLEGLVAKSLKDSVREVLLPGMENATQVIFQQIEQAFTQRMDDIKRTVQADCKRQEKVTPLTATVPKEMLQDLQSTRQELKNARADVASLQSALAALQEAQAQQSRKHDSQLQALLEAQAQQSRKHDSQLQALLEAQAQQSRKHDSQLQALLQLAQAQAHSASGLQHSVAQLTQQLQESSAKTEPTLAELKQLVASNQLNVAFEKAMRSSDRNLLTNLCATLNETAVLEGMGFEPLSNPLLLSLIQQLSYNLDQPQVQLLWIKEACNALDIADPRVAPHVRSVFSEVEQKLSSKFPSVPRQDPLFMLLHKARRALAGALTTC